MRGSDEVENKTFAIRSFQKTVEYWERKKNQLQGQSLRDVFP